MINKFKKEMQNMIGKLVTVNYINRDKQEEFYYENLRVKYKGNKAIINDKHNCNKIKLNLKHIIYIDVNMINIEIKQLDIELHNGHVVQISNC